MHHKMKTIRSKNHQLRSYEINKISLSCFDDKRFTLSDGKASLAYGHFMTKTEYNSLLSKYNHFLFYYTSPLIFQIITCKCLKYTS